ncbi:expressed unknown protein [Seminavis robusta]|uniref:Uncharacterized protein n=1 Tax=Seminavis robusta TaxID=568900 RepID=A0A9N8HC41_9STRA|nr:expressed unknown protein [Seminavis robusta]|eukprot:Sro303_g112450.1 n/a (193) ;mRNA; r:52358-52936
MSSLSLLLTRRTTLTLASRAGSRLFVARAMNSSSAQPKKDYFNATSDDTNMHDQFQILEGLLEDNLNKADKNRQALKRLVPMAVDATDGETDGHVQDELREIQVLLEEVAVSKEEIKERLAKLHVQMEEAQKIFAVDSPDGEVDGHIEEEMEEIKHIIDDAAEHEDKDKIEYQHKMEDAVRKDRARDPEHDW